jgi:tetratricopeptide (TPR) repeat protein
MTRQPQAIVFFGPGGQGKSALAKHLQTTIENENPRETLLGIVNFAGGTFTGAYDALLNLRRQLGRHFAFLPHVRFLAFDVAFACFWEKRFPALDLHMAKSGLFEKGSILAELAEATGTIPGAGLAYKALNFVKESALHKLAERTYVSLKELPELQAQEIEARLCEYLIDDLIAYTTQDPELNIVVAFDSFEELTAAAGGRDLGADLAFEPERWVRRLVSRAFDAESCPILFAFFGRRQLDWEKWDDRWNGLLSNQNELNPIPYEDACKRLEQAGVLDRELYEPMIGTVHGHPLGLELQIIHYVSLKSKLITPTPSDFLIGTTEADSRIGELLGNFLRHRTPEERKFLSFLAITHRFNLDLAEQLTQAFHLSISPLALEETLSSYSFIEDLGNKTYRIHPLLREVLLTTLQFAVRRKVENYIFEYYSERCRPADRNSITPDHERALETAFLHLDRNQPTNAATWIGDHAKIFLEAGRYSITEPMFRDALRLYEESGETMTEGFLLSLYNVARVLELTGNYDRSKDYYQYALTTSKELFGPKHPDVGTRLNDLGLVYWEMGQLDEAQEFLERALQHGEEHLGLDHPNVAVRLNNLALIYEGKGLNTKASGFIDER